MEIVAAVNIIALQFGQIMEAGINIFHLIVELVR